MSLRFNAINNLSTSQEANVEGSAKITGHLQRTCFYTKDSKTIFER
jgi:hypothetical protein